MKKIVFSFWTAPLTKRWKTYTEKLNLSDDAIFDASLNCLYLAILYAKKQGFEVEVFTDCDGEQHLKKLPIDHLSTELAFLTYTNTWVEGKIYAISKQNKPFVYIDWDVFLMGEEAVKIIKRCKTDILLQSIDPIVNDLNTIPIEASSEQEVKNFQYLMNFSPFFVEDFHKVNQFYANTAVLGFNNLKIRDSYVYEFLKCLSVARKYENADHSRIIDQQLLYTILQSSKVSYATVLSDQDRQTEAETIGYTHLHCLSKYVKKTQNKIVQKIKKEFPEYAFLVNKPSPIKNPIKISFCTVVMNRFDHFVTTLKSNIEVVKKFQGIIDLNILDYNSTDGLEDFLFEQKWFKNALKSDLVKYFKNTEAKKYHRTLPKNCIHFLASGEYLVNLDADNFINYDYLKYCLSLTKNKTNFFLRPSKNSTRGAFGRIMIHRKDFEEIGGYNLKIKTYGFEDSEITLRLRKLGKQQILVPLSIKMEMIEHENELRIVNEQMESFGVQNSTSILYNSEKNNRNLPFELYPNKGKILDIQLFEKNENLDLTEVTIFPLPMN